MTLKTAYLSLGSNLGDREKNISSALAAFKPRGIRVVRRSALYATEPVDFRPQGWFLNCVAEIETDLMPLQLLRAIREIECKLGRRRLVPAGPRAIDIDVLLYGSSIVRSPSLEIPHPRMAMRRFVLVPLRELVPSLRHPLLHRTVSELLAETSDRSRVRLWHG